MNAYNRIGVSLLVAGALALSGCWMVRGDGGRGDRHRQDRTDHHDDRRDRSDQHDQRNLTGQRPLADVGAGASGLS